MSSKSDGYELQNKDHGLGWTLRWWSVTRGIGEWHTVKLTTFERAEGSPVEKSTETIVYSGHDHHVAADAFDDQRSAQYAK